MDLPITPSAGGRRRTDPAGRRRLVARWLLGAAGGLFALFLVLPILNAGPLRGWQLVGRVASLLFTDAGDLFATAVRLTALQATCSFVVVAAALAAGFRTFGRVAACVLVLASWVVAGVVIWETPRALSALAMSILNGQGTLAWFACFPILAVAAFVWPRPARRFDPDGE